VSKAVYALRGLVALGLLLALPCGLPASGWDRVPGTRAPDTARTPLLDGRPLVRPVQRPDEPSVWDRLTAGLRHAARRAADLLWGRDDGRSSALRSGRPAAH
jgi:hypothetical protein